MTDKATGTTKMEAGTMKWQAGPGVLFCTRMQYDSNKSLIIMPGKTTKETVYRVESVGPGIEGYKEGDIVAMEKGNECAQGVFIRIQNVLGRLVPENSPNSAVATPPASPAPPNGEGVVAAMAGAD